MQTKVFNLFFESIQNNLALLSNDFLPDTSFEDTSSVAKTLESLACQVDNLRISLVKGYHGSEK